MVPASLFMQFATGALLGVFGYRLFRLLVLMTGVLVGMAAGFDAAAEMPGSWIAPLLPVLGGILGGLLCGVAVWLTLFTFGAYAGVTAAFGLAQALGVSGVALEWTAVCAALAGGLLALVYRRVWIVAGTALCGAQLVSEALFGWSSGCPARTASPGGYPMFLWPAFDPDYFTVVNGFLFGATWALLSFFFIVVQAYQCRDMAATRLSGHRFERERS